MRKFIDFLLLVSIIGLLFAFAYEYKYSSDGNDGKKIAVMSCVLPSKHVLTFNNVRKIVTKKDNEIYFELMDGERVALHGDYTCVIKETP